MPRNDWGTWKIILIYGLLVLFLFVMLGPYHLMQWLFTIGFCTAFSALVTETLLLKNRLSFYTVLLRLFKHVQTIVNNVTIHPSSSSGGDDDGNKIPKKSADQGSQYLSEAHVDIDTCLHFILRDFVLSWYHSLSSNNQFSKDVYYVLEDLSAALYSRIRKVNKYKFAKNFITSYHMYFKEYLKCLDEVKKHTGKSSILECIENTTDIEACFKNYHSALTSPETEITYLKNVTTVILEVLTPVDLLTCSVARKFIVDVIANNVLLPLMDHVTDPNWINKKSIILLTDDVPGEKISHWKGKEKSLFETLTKDQKLSMQSENISLERYNITDVSYDLIKSDNSHRDSSRGKGNDSVDDVVINKYDSVSLTSKCSEEDNEFSKNQFNASSSERSMKSSKSFEHLSNFVLNRLVELEKPIEYITENLSHYFRIANEETDQTDNITGSSSKTLSNVKSSSSNRIDAAGMNTRDPKIPSSLHLRRSSTSIIEQSHSISHALEDAMAASAGPVLANKLDTVKTQGFHTEEITNESSQMSQEQFHPHDSSSTKGSVSADVNNMDSSLKEENLHLNLSLSSASATELNTDDQQCTYTLDQNGSVMEAVEMSPDNRCFMNLFIPSAEIAEEPGGIGHYVLYCIQYEAWYLDTSPVHAPNSDVLVDISEPRMILQGSQVKRRFREFLVLHSRLEENLQIRPFLQNIQKPNRWMTLPFNKIDHDITEERRMFLERYLQKLISIEEIAASNELREFLAYGSDASIAFVKKVPDSMVPRIDKFLAKKVSGMWEKFRVVLPTSVEHSALDVPVMSLAKTTERKSFLGFQFGAQEGNYPINVNIGHPETEPDLHQLEENMKRFINDNKDIDWIDGLKKSKSDENLVLFAETPTPLSPDKSVASSVFSNEDFVDSNISQENDSFYFDESNLTNCMVCIDRDLPLASTVINLGIDGILNEKSLVKKNRFIFFLKWFAGQHLESWINNKIDDRTTVEMNIKYLRQIRDSIWPGGVLPMEPDSKMTEEEKITVKMTALQKLKDFFPSFLPLFLGAKEYNDVTRLFQSSLQHPKLLRHFMYNALDLLFITIVPEAKTDSFCQRFMNNIS